MSNNSKVKKAILNSIQDQTHNLKSYLDKISDIDMKQKFEQYIYSLTTCSGCHEKVINCDLEDTVGGLTGNNQDYAPLDICIPCNEANGDEHKTFIMC